MKITVEFLLTHEVEVCDVGRIPCVGEFVALGAEGDCHEVKEVIHFLNADAETQVAAEVRVK